MLKKNQFKPTYSANIDSDQANVIIYNWYVDLQTAINYDFHLGLSMSFDIDGPDKYDYLCIDFYIDIFGFGIEFDFAIKKSLFKKER